MKKLLIIAALAALAGCTTINVTIPGKADGTYTININANKDVPITNTASPSGNTVPVGATQ